MIWIWVSLGSVTIAVPLLVVAISYLLLLEFLQHDVQRTNRSDHERSYSETQSWMGLSALPLSRYSRRRPASRTDCSDLPSTRRCFETCGWASPSCATRSFQWPLAAGEDVEDLSPPRLCDGVERVCGRRWRAMSKLYTHIGTCQSMLPPTLRSHRMGQAIHDRGGWPTNEPIDMTEHALADWELLMDAIVGELGAPAS